MAVNLTDLSPASETEFLTSSIGQLKVVQTKFVEAKDSLSVLNQTTKEKSCLFHSPVLYPLHLP
ncbi:hypothetical protein WMY93_034083 [Mugilogobius chulae]|uniref:Prefoldin subunit 5 n=1 Tax=Mugilogobius chulae TaxID=88201 RepID=A0AAW0MH04_9GOBI